jgi:hypothetical protein
MKSVETKRTRKRVKEKEAVVQRKKTKVLKAKSDEVRCEPEVVARYSVRQVAVSNENAMCGQSWDEARGPRNATGHDNHTGTRTSMPNEAAIDKGARKKAAPGHGACQAWHRGMNLVAGHTALKACAKSESTPGAKTTGTTAPLSLSRQSDKQEGKTESYSLPAHPCVNSFQLV